MDKTDVIIVGAGLSGLAVAHFLNRARPDLRLRLLEKADRPGGAIRSFRSGGFLAEWGPHGFLDNIEESCELLSDLDVDDQVQKAPLKQFLRYICRSGKLEVIPQTPPAIIRSDLMSLPAKIRVLGDLFRKPRSEEQTIANWASYRFGKEILPFADIAMTGTYAGDIERLSIDAAMPGLRLLEREHGSVFRGAIRSRKKKEGGGMPSMVSFKDGMEHLVKSLAASQEILLNSGVNRIIRENNTWRIVSDTGEHVAENLVVALHINRALPLLGDLSSTPEKSVAEAIVYNVVMGFESGADIPYGFGYLAPKAEKRFALGTLFPTHMFPGRAPEGMSSLEVLIGGIRNPGHLELSDDDLWEKAFADISQLIRLPDKPAFIKVLRPEIGIPQLEIGHHRLQNYRGSLEQGFPGLYITGFGWEGIGVNDMIKQAKQTAGNLLRGQGSNTGPVTVKGVYF